MTVPVSPVSVEADAAAHRLVLAFPCDAPPSAVWAALTEPESVSRWLAPVAPAPDGEGRYLLTFEHEGETHTKTFAVTACEPGARLAGVLHDPGFPDSSLEARIDGGRVLFTHSSVPEALFGGYRAGWSYYLGTLAGTLGAAGARGSEGARR